MAKICQTSFSIPPSFSPRPRAERQFGGRSWDPQLAESSWREPTRLNGNPRQKALIPLFPRGFNQRSLASRGLTRGFVLRERSYAENCPIKSVGSQRCSLRVGKRTSVGCFTLRGCSGFFLRLPRVLSSLRSVFRILRLKGAALYSTFRCCSATRTALARYELNDYRKTTRTDYFILFLFFFSCG
jgi:hypothetical protein